MKVCLTLLVLLPLAYSMTVDLDSLTEDQKRFLFDSIPSLQSVKDSTCAALQSETAHTTCELACEYGLKAIPLGSLATSMCPSACHSLHC